MLNIANKIALVGITTFYLMTPKAVAKGLETLADKNPENAPAAGEGTGDAAATAAAPMEQSAASKAIAQKLWLATTFGWAHVSSSKGEWKGSGMTDIAVGYKVLPLAANMSVDATYRYAPIAVSGQVDDRSYRGVWDCHYLGGRFNYKMSDSLSAVGTAEAGYVLVYLRPTDGLDQESKHEENGFSMVVGGGADWHLLEKGAVSAGPRLNVGFGSVTTIQVAGAATFVF